MLETTPVDHGLLRFITCGSVDDGKSSLIGRLLYDSRAILADALRAIERSSRRRGADRVDLSLLTDGLQAEREQGITIDVAYRYFSTGTRKYILADTPGHEQYTRNMVTGASTADLAIILVDARKGPLTQTRRHTALAHLMGIRHLLVAVNKMDLVDWQEPVFARICAEVRGFAAALDIPVPRFLPLSALHGDMVVERGANLPWYAGPTLLEILEGVELERVALDQPFRFPVQRVCRPRTQAHADYRGLQGRVESGRIRCGDPVLVQPSGRPTRVRSLELHGRALAEAIAGQSITLHLEDEVDVARGDLLSDAHRPALLGRRLEALLCWFAEDPLRAGRSFLLRHGTRELRVEVEAILDRLDLEDLRSMPADQVVMNDIARVSLKLHQPLAADPYDQLRANGAFILIDADSNATVAAGLIHQLA